MQVDHFTLLHMSSTIIDLLCSCANKCCVLGAAKASTNPAISEHVVLPCLNMLLHTIGVSPGTPATATATAAAVVTADVQGTAQQASASGRALPCALREQATCLHTLLIFSSFLAWDNTRLASEASQVPIALAQDHVLISSRQPCPYFVIFGLALPHLHA